MKVNFWRGSFDALLYLTELAHQVSTCNSMQWPPIQNLDGQTMKKTHCTRLERSRRKRPNDEPKLRDRKSSTANRTRQKSQMDMNR